MQLIRSLIFNATMYLSMLVFAVAYAPASVYHAKYAVRATQTWCHFIIWCASWMLNLKVDVRGTPPTDEVMIAANAGRRGKGKEIVDRCS